MPSSGLPSNLSFYSSDPNRVAQLTLITDTVRFTGEQFFDVVEQALQGGVDAVLVREKHLTSARLLALASRLRQMTTAYHARLIIHGQADIAAAVDADGVHLASVDIPEIAAVCQWLADDRKTVSVSCHHADELGLASQYGADYAMLSPIFPTACHPGAPYLGVDTFRQLAATSSIPVIALGGINTSNCLILEGQPVAVMGALLNAANPRLAAQQLLASVRGGPE